ncbi:hypothetical protein EV179_000478 [Coemansia sp. RSA 487]|nr:hypothetical protein EV179_000478 [Coemansia sp. RSA 487]
MPFTVFVSNQHQGTIKDTHDKETSADVWRKRYAEASVKAKLGSPEKIKGIIPVPDFQRCSPVQYVQANHISCTADARIPGTNESKRYYSSVSITHRSSVYDGEVLEDVIPVKIGETVLIAAPTPLTGRSSLLSFWNSRSNDASASDDDMDKSVSGPFARAMQVVSISRGITGNEWKLHGCLLLPERDTILQEISLTNEWCLVDEYQTYSFKQHFCGKISVPFIATRVDLDVDAWIAENRYVQPWCISCNHNEKTPDIRLGRAFGGVKRCVMSTMDKDDSDLSISKRSLVFLETAAVNGIKYHLNDIAILRSMRVIPPNLRPGSAEKEYDDARHLFWTPLIREADTSTFRGKCSEATRDMYLQIGNAIPLPLAYALGLELCKALFKDFAEFFCPDVAEDAENEVESAIGSFLEDFCVDIQIAESKCKTAFLLLLAPLDLSDSAKDVETLVSEQEIFS